MTTADDAAVPRDADAYQYILGGDNSPASVDADSLIDLVYTANARYRANGSFAMNSVTMGQVRKLKASGTGDYIFQPSLIQGQPSTLLGYPVFVIEAYDNPEGGKPPVSFGDHRRGFMLTDIAGGQIRVTVDPYTSAGSTKFYCRRRVGGCVYNNDAVKWLKLL